MRDPASRASRMAVGLIAALLVGALAHAGLRAAEEEAASGSRPRRTSRSSAGKSASKLDERRIDQKLDEIIENQQKILKRFDEVMEELRIVKIRATLN